MDEKYGFRQRTTESGSKRHFKGKAKQNSVQSASRKQKLHSGKRINMKEEMLRQYQVREEDKDENGAEETLQSAKHTGTVVTDSAGKALQKRHIKKQMVVNAQQKRTKEAAKETYGMAGKMIDRVEGAVGNMGDSIAKFVADNPFPVMCVLMLGIILIVVVASLSSCTMIIGSFQGSAVTTTYTAEDSEILATDAYYSDLESQLQGRIDQIETDYPGYDEYEYALDNIDHDPYQLASLLSVLYEDYTVNEVTGTLIGIFDEQYVLTLKEKEETRTRIEIKTRWEKKTRTEERQGTRLKWDEVNKKFVLETYTYEVDVEYWEEVEYEEEVEYQYYILQVELTNHTVDTVVQSLGLTDEQMKRYELLTVLKGNKSYLF